MLKMMFLAYRRAGMDAEEFQRYWREIHAPIASKIPGLRKYVQNHSARASDGSDPPYDGIAEMWFEDATSFETPEFQTSWIQTVHRGSVLMNWRSSDVRTKALYACWTRTLSRPAS
jgi:uncharacterized protein (TIGR02118 family)